MSVVTLSPAIPVGLLSHGCGLFPLHLPPVREYGGERILVPAGKPKRAPRKPKRVVAIRRRRRLRARAI